MSCSERKRELRRRQHRKKKIEIFARKLAIGHGFRKGHHADKLRSLTPGGEVIIDTGNWKSDKHFSLALILASLNTAR